MITPLAALMLGLTGGFGHCVSMCFPFVLYVSGRYPAVGYSILIPHIKYNLGRITAYSILGICAGYLGGRLSAVAPLQKALLIGARVLLILFALSNLGLLRIPLPKIAWLQRFMPKESAYLTGVVLGFIPCGMVYSALAASAASAQPLMGGLSMALFGLGTSAAMMLTALFGGLLMNYAKLAKVIFSILLIVSGVLFIYKGIAFL